MTEEPMQDNTMNETEPAKVFDYAKIVADALTHSFDYTDTRGRAPPIQLKKKSAEELMAQAEAESDNDGDDDDAGIVEVHESIGERSIRTLTNVPMIHAFNMAEARLEIEAAAAAAKKNG
ncbi:unnamed protein product [Caenorhabditis sp. 36 PRJEB53466]|nr:unnamed protein product [Caenorhabditis sp. 36 PRJEB53466]